MNDLVKKDLSSELSLDVDWNEDKKGMLRLSISYDGKGADLGLYVDVDAKYLINKIADKIPGTVDDMILKALLAAVD